MTDKPPRLGELLIAAGAIAQPQLERALAQQREWGCPLGTTLVRMGILDEGTLVRALASQLNLPVVSLRGKRINNEILDLVPAATAEKYLCLPLLLNGQGDERALYVAVEDPTDKAALEQISADVGMPVQPVLVSPSELEEGINRHYNWNSSEDSSTDSDFRSSTAPLQKTSTSSPSDPNRMPSLAGTTGPFSGLADDGGDFDGLAEPLAEPAAVAKSQTASGTESIELDSEIPEVLEFAEPVPDAYQGEQVEPAASPGANSTDSMLRAIAQLLIEKGIFTRDELVERLTTISREVR